MGCIFNRVTRMGSHIFRIIFGVRIFWQVGSLGIEKYRTIWGTKMTVKYMFYIHFNKCVNPFLNDLIRCVI